MGNLLDRGIQRMGGIAAIFITASYSFTLGYIEYLKIPETPEYLEATNFFIRAVLYAGMGKALLYVMLPILVFLVLVYTLECILEKFLKRKKRCKSFTMYLILIFLTIAYSLCMYCFGRESLKNSKGSAFPIALLWEKSQERVRIVWLGKKAVYYLRCNSIKPELRGVDDERKIIFARSLDEDSSSRLCGR